MSITNNLRYDQILEKLIYCNFEVLDYNISFNLLKSYRVATRFFKIFSRFFKVHIYGSIFSLKLSLTKKHVLKRYYKVTLYFLIFFQLKKVLIRQKILFIW